MTRRVDARDTSAQPSAAQDTSRVLQGAAAHPPVFAFFHVALMSGWEGIVDEQMNLFRSSGLYDRIDRLFVGIIGSGDLGNRFDDPKVAVTRHAAPLEHGEFATLRLLAEHARNTDSLVCYLHTKGVHSSHRSPHVHDWRRYMAYFIIERFEACIDALGSHDVCGVNWAAEPWPHFSGNFWWARSEYIRTLPPIDEVRSRTQDHPFALTFELGERHNAERWIGASPSVKVACLHRSGVNHYDTAYPRHNYARDSVSARIAAYLGFR